MVSRLKKLTSHTGFIKYLKNTSWLFIEKILRIMIGLFVGIWIARYLGPEQFGLYSYAQSFVALFAVIASLGLDGIIVRELVKDTKRRETLLGTAFFLKFIGAFLVLIFLAIAINFTTNDNTTNIFIFIIGASIIFQSFNVIDYYFQSKVLSKYVVYANILTLSISSIVKIELILNEAPLIYFVWVVLFDNIVLACGYLYFYSYNHLSILNWKFDKLLALSLLKESWPLILSAFVISIYMKIDQVMIKEMLNTQSVGQYAAAVRLSEALYFFPAVVVNSVFPAIINAKKQSEVLYYQRLQKLYNLMVWSALAVAIPMTFLGDWLITMFFGVDYNKTSQVFIIHIWTLVFVSLMLSSGKWIINEGFMKSALFRNLAGVFFNIFLNYFLIKNYGILGAAYATLISYSVAGFFYDFFDKNLKKNFYIKLHALFPIIPVKGIKFE